MAKSDDVERIRTLHPEGKQGVNIERAKYDAMRAALLAALPADEHGISLAEAEERVERTIDRDVFTPDVSVVWYLVTVKQDLEARGELEKFSRRGRQHLRRT